MKRYLEFIKTQEKLINIDESKKEKLEIEQSEECNI